ncbi:Sec-independent protein translocase protein TatB [Sphingomonas segetis]|jgi:sec-independent protein translocase protein TatB|uniref:Sec-independent protein translocase protein TatB n=1 Tax=Sphingomonas segetis TaxID=1104779 RepID=UPI0012D2CEA9|nr:Sec-independent protein translocase protein TatB [Sphingomonas segetis]
MFGIDSSELAVVAILALIFIGPKDLPKVMRTAGYWVGKVRGMARHFTSGIENMVREAELEEMEKRWREENERIMQLHPADAHYPEPGQPDDMPPLAEVPEPRLPLDESQPEDEIPPEKRPLP